MSNEHCLSSNNNNDDIKSEPRNSTVQQELKSQMSDPNYLLIKKEDKYHLDPLCVMNIEIEKGKIRQIELFRNKTPEEMAYDFCKNNDLDFKSMRSITNQIKDKMKGVMKRENYSQSEEHKDRKSNICSPKRGNNDVIYNKQRMNYGEYLYIKGKDQQTKVNEKIEKIKKENEDTQTIELTFHPKLNRVKSFNAFKNKAPNIRSNTVGKTIHVKTKHKAQSKGNDNIYNINTTNTNVNKKKQNIHPSTPTYTFRPKINTNYKVKTKFEERLNKYITSHKKGTIISNDLNDDTIKKKEILYDTTTGQILFRPKLVAKNICKVNINPKNVFQINYDYASYYRRNKEELISNANSQFNKVRFVPNDTNRIFTEKKISAFKFIFELLDSDEDGAISAININRKALDARIDDIISPIITQIIQQKVIIEENDFIQAMDVLFNAVSVNEKNEILNVKKYYGKRQQKDIMVINGIHKDKMLKNSMSDLFEKRKNKFL
jgi:hypothetical protein